MKLGGNDAMENLFFGILIIFNFFGIADSLKCFAGNPSRNLECNTISYCLFITSRTGRTQWSCDGNGITQLSICTSFGMDSPRHRIYEAPPSSRQEPFYRPSDASASSASSSGSVYYVKQKPDSRFSNDLPSGGDPSTFDDSTRKNGQRCFDGGQIGKVCCCDTDFCNFSPSFFVPSFQRVASFVGFFIFVYHFFVNT